MITVEKLTLLTTMQISSTNLPGRLCKKIYILLGYQLGTYAKTLNIYAKIY